MAPTKTELTTTSWAREPRPNSLLRKSSAPEMTPVSNPNSNPPMAATMATFNTGPPAAPPCVSAMFTPFARSGQARPT